MKTTPLKKPIKLGIIIPAYKAQYLDKTLSSISKQSDKRFHLYIADDASTENLEEICAPYRSTINLTYIRFEQNLGAISLAGHWNRAVAISKEPWLWLFCDDDIMDPGCVEAFLRVLNDGFLFQVYRFNTRLIDENGTILRNCPPHPTVESGIAFARNRFQGKRMSFVTEYIFSRKTFNNNGGFVEFPMAWCSDDASWISFSHPYGIRALTSAKVCWRQSEINISRSSSKYQIEKIEAIFQYLSWLEQFIKDNLHSSTIKDEKKMWDESKVWFFFLRDWPTV